VPGLVADRPPRSLRHNMVSWYAVAPPLLPELARVALISPDALEAATSSLSIEARKRAEKDALKKAQKAEAAEAKQAATIASSKVIIKRVERNKRKYVTAVSGLEAFGLDNKKVAKDFGKKFATGSSVTKLPSGGEEIVVQGDVSDEIEEFLLDNYKVIPEDNIELVEDKKKKKDTAGG
jgi:density-regulated protein DRP1